MNARRFSSLIAAEARFATQRQKFHTDDVIQYLHNKSGSHGVPKANLFNFTILLVDFVLCIFHRYGLFCYRFIAFILPSVLGLSFINNG